MSKSENELNILLVEDQEPDAILGKARILEVLPNSKITITGSVGEAYEANKNNNFDLVILDLNLPDAYGAATVREMRNFYKNVPIVVLTGMGTNITVNQAIKNGANEVVLKTKILGTEFEDALKKYAHNQAPSRNASKNN